MAIKKIKVSGTSYDVNDPRIAGVDNTPTSGSNNVVTSGGIYNYLHWEDVATVNEDDYQDPANGHAYVDLGLRSNGNKILFATMNIGATNPQDYGDYFAWGETSKRYISIDGTSIVGGTFYSSNAPFKDGSTWTKYNATDSKLVLDAADDVASVLWGGSWRMPDKADLQYLLNSTYCTAAWTSNYNSTGVAGLVVTGNGDYASNSIFFPAAGFCEDEYVFYTGDFGRYWSHSRHEERYSYAYSLGFIESGPDTDDRGREYGYSVRPVLVIPDSN